MRSDRPLRPTELLDFVELRPFTRRWDEMRLSDDALADLQTRLMREPRAGSVIPGTKGLRKMRYVPPEWGIGKRGALRVCYVYFERFFTVLLVVAYKKSEQKDLPADAIRRINQEIDRAERELERRFRARQK
ncbi:MAG: hypothetical protein HYS13_05300 [Planctomycetia bacterium]|nr:hypothetical protein [Planctomycetia bacterium]